MLQRSGRAMSGSAALPILSYAFSAIRCGSSRLCGLAQALSASFFSNLCVLFQQNLILEKGGIPTGKTATKFNIIRHFPETEEGKQELARRVAIVHADSIIERLKKLECSTDQKLRLLDAIIEDAKQKKRHEPER